LAKSLRKTRAREGDFVETSEHLIFDVKGLIHPCDRIISFLRYVPASEGDREKNGVHYRKIYDLERRWDYLRKHYPEYVHFDDFLGRELQSVPLSKLSVHHEPKNKLKALLKNGGRDQVERDAVELAEYLAGKARISTDDVGIS
jgi:predicted nucleotidyltransferase